eukprot:14504-Heterococcus_DN1.PRE.1
MREALRGSLLGGACQLARWCPPAWPRSLLTIARHSPLSAGRCCAVASPIALSTRMHTVREPACGAWQPEDKLDARIPTL